MTKKLTKRDLTKFRKTIGTAWEIPDTGDALIRTFVFSRFIEAFMFVTRVGIHAEVLHQYPHIILDANIVLLTLTDRTTHTITPDNFELAKKIDVIFALSTPRKHDEATHD